MNPYYLTNTKDLENHASNKRALELRERYTSGDYATDRSQFVSDLLACWFNSITNAKFPNRRASIIGELVRASRQNLQVSITANKFVSDLVGLLMADSKPYFEIYLPLDNANYTQPLVVESTDDDVAPRLSTEVSTMLSTLGVLGTVDLLLIFTKYFAVR